MITLKKLIAAIEGNYCWRELYLSNIEEFSALSFRDSYDDKMIIELFEALGRNTQVTSLTLRGHVCLSSKGADALADLIKVNKTLDVINDITIDKNDKNSGETIYNALLQNNSIRWMLLQSLGPDLQSRIFAKCGENMGHKLIRSLQKGVNSITIDPATEIARYVFGVLMQERHMLDSMIFRTNSRIDVAHDSSKSLQYLYKYMASNNWSLTKMTVSCRDFQMHDMLRCINSLPEPICLEDLKWDNNDYPRNEKISNNILDAISNNKLCFAKELAVLLASQVPSSVAGMIVSYINNSLGKISDKALGLLIEEIKDKQDHNANKDITKNKKLIIFSDIKKQAEMTICKRPAMKVVLNSYSKSNNINFAIVAIKNLLNKTYSADIVKNSSEGLQYRCDILKIIARYGKKTLNQQDKQFLANIKQGLLQAKKELQQQQNIKVAV